jgi:hypothetical protein
VIRYSAVQAATVAELQAQLASYPPYCTVHAFNGDDGCVLPITGLLYDPENSTIEFCTDEP